MSGSVDVDNLYTGHYYHLESKLSLAPFRAYDASIARWLSRDPLDNAEMLQGPNLYTYVANNPINLWDPLGLAWVITKTAPGATLFNREKGTSRLANIGDVVQPGEALKTADSSGFVELGDDKNLDGPDGKPRCTSIKGLVEPVNSDYPELGTKPYVPKPSYLERVGPRSLWDPYPSPSQHDPSPWEMFKGIRPRLDAITTGPIG